MSGFVLNLYRRLLTTTDGIYIGDRRLEKGDTTGSQSAQVILQDPTVEIAVLETARDDILQSGLAFEHCDVGVVLNVAADRLGAEDIHTIDRMARVNGVVARTVRSDGYAVLNADDERVAAMAGQVLGKVAYFSMNPNHPLVRSHVQQGGIAAVYDRGHLSILQQDWVHQIEKAECVTHTLGGCAPFMIANALAASLVAFVRGVKVEQIRAALNSFEPLAQQTSGQINLFDLRYYQFDLLKQYPVVEDAQIGTLETLLSQPISDRQPIDRLALSIRNGSVNGVAIAFENGLQQKELYAGIARETSNGLNGLKVGSRSTVRDYPTQRSVDDLDRLEAPRISQDHTPLASAPPAKTVAPTPETTTVAGEFDFPTDAIAHPDRLRGFAKMVKTQIEAMQPKFMSAKETLGQTLKTLTIVAKTIKQRGVKTWAADQSTHVKDWAKERAPIARHVAINAVRKIVEQAIEKGAVIGAIALTLGRTAAGVALEKVQKLGAIAWEKFEKATQLVDPVTLDPALKDAIALLGKDGRFEGEVFDFQQTKTGVDVYLKDGTSVYTDGKLNFYGDSRLTYRLSKIPENIAQIKADISQQLTARDYQKQWIEGRGLSR